MRIKSFLVIIITICLLMQNDTRSAYAEISVDAGEADAIFTTDMQSALDGAEEILYNNRPFSDWAMIGFAKNGRVVPKGYLEEAADKILENRGQFNLVADLERLALSYTAAGGNMNNIAGIDLVPILMNHKGMENQGLDGLINAYMVVQNSGPTNFNMYSDWLPDDIYNRILELQLDDGSWSLTGTGIGSVDVTALALTSIGPMALRSGAEISIQKSLDWLRSKQATDGSLDGSTMSTAKVIVALSTLGIDAITFKQEGRHLLDGLLSHQLTDGGFSDEGDTQVNMQATEQAYLALVAYKLLAEDARTLFSSLNKQGKATIQIEGPEGTIGEGRIQGGNALEAAITFLEQSNIGYKMQGNSSNKSFSSFGGILNGHYGGNDSWMYAVESQGSWMFPSVEMLDYHLSEGDRLLIYYSDGETELIDEVAIEWVDEYGQRNNGYPLPAGVPFDMYVKKSNRALGYVPASGVTLSLYGQTFMTDKEGKVTSIGLPSGVHQITMTGYQYGTAPIIAKSVLNIRISSPQLSAFTDQASVSSWARVDMANALSNGFIQGISTTNHILAPKRNLTRAEFITLLLRLLGESTDTHAKTSFIDVAADKWYSGNIAKAVERGIVNGSDKKFEPNRAITREETAVMIANAFHLAPFGSKGHVPFNDTSNLPATSQNAIQVAYEYQVMIGSGGKFNPQTTLVREQAAAILARLHHLRQSGFIL